MAEGEVGAFDLMFHIQLGKAVVAGAALLLLGRTAECAAMLHEMPGQVFLLGLTGAMGQVPPPCPGALVYLSPRVAVRTVL